MAIALAVFGLLKMVWTIVSYPLMIIRILLTACLLSIGTVLYLPLFVTISFTQYLDLIEGDRGSVWQQMLLSLPKLLTSSYNVTIYFGYPLFPIYLIKRFLEGELPVQSYVSD